MEAEYCSFCGKHRDEVIKIVSGPAQVGICNECHDLMRDLMPPPSPPQSDEQRAANQIAFDKFIAEQGADFERAVEDEVRAQRSAT